ncbi:hypothetical protein ACFL3I_09700 [Pseudomonadota bacterium]
MSREQDLGISFWMVYLVLTIVSLRNVIEDDWLVTFPTVVLSLLLIVLVTLKSVASRIRWSAVAALMMGLLITAVILRKVIWIPEHLVLDQRVLFLVVLTIVAIVGRLSHVFRMRRRYRRARQRESSMKKRRGDSK